MNFGTNLRNLRIARNLTQMAVAKDLGISQASITAYETGTREPSFDVVRRFADYFGVSPFQLMPFGDYSIEENVQRMAESIHQNPKLRLLFDRTKNLSESDLDAVISVVSAISKERNDDT